MMDLKQKKMSLVSLIRELISRPYIQQNPDTVAHFSNLVHTIERDFYTIVVLGEFKRGKSTLVNALLGKPVLPMDVLPETATINAIMYNEIPILNVVWKDGHEEKGEVSNTYLSQFSARNKDFIADNVQYIKIGYPKEFLKNRIVLVDTPGVSDINEERCDITYHFIPKANAVLFLLDANSPLKKTEKDFIDKKLLAQGIKNIIFLVNKFDDVDEEEEEDVLDELQDRLFHAFKMDTDKPQLNSLEIYPISAKMALAGIEKNNNDLINTSGFPAFSKKLHNMIYNGNLEQEKLLRYVLCFIQELNHVKRELETQKSLKQASLEELEHTNGILEQMISENEKNKENIRRFAMSEKDKIYAMTDKSLNFFSGKLKEEITDSILEYQGTNFKNYIELSIKKRIKNNLESWVGIYSPHINDLIKTLESEIAKGLSFYFHQRIQIQSRVGDEMRQNKIVLNLQAEDISNVNLEAGAVAAIGAVGLMTLVGGTIMPLISFAALPYLRENMLRKRLNDAKQQVIPDVQHQLAQAIVSLKNTTHQYIDERCEQVCQNSEYAYNVVLQDIRDKIQQQIQDCRSSRGTAKKDIENIDQAVREINKLIDIMKGDRG